MTATISLKQLRTDPRRLVQLLNNGYEISITDHRQTLTTAHSGAQLSKSRQPGDIDYILETIESLPPVTPIYPEMGTVELVNKLRLEAYEAKRQRIDEQWHAYHKRRGGRRPS